MKQTAIEIGYSAQLLHRIKLEVLVNEFRPNEISILEDAFEDAWRRLERQRSLTPRPEPGRQAPSHQKRRAVLTLLRKFFASHRPSLGRRK
jgi:hypothetical protein